MILLAPPLSLSINMCIYIYTFKVASKAGTIHKTAKKGAHKEALPNNISLLTKA